MSGPESVALAKKLRPDLVPDGVRVATDELWDLCRVLMAEDQPTREERRVATAARWLAEAGVA